MNVNKSILFILVSFIFINCKRESDKILRLDNLNHESLSYDDLPNDIRLVYEEAAVTESSKKTLVNFMNKYEIDLHTVTFSESHLKVLFNGYNHDFIVNRSYILKLKANQGDPFVFYNNSFYYTEELNLRHSNYKQSKYIKINLDKFFKKFE